MKRLCGFCDVTDEDKCITCAVEMIRLQLEKIENKIQWEHNIKYRADGEEEVNNCAHCKHVICEETCYQAAHNWCESVYCRLDNPGNMDEHGGYIQRKPYQVCPKWERASL